MRAIKSRDTKIEVTLAKALWNKGYRYRKNYKKITGKPDIVFPSYRIAVFCDSEFWHGKDWQTSKQRIKSNRKFWYSKIEGNIRRDKEVNQTLKKDNWTVLRFWGLEIKNDLDKCLSVIEQNIKQKMKNTYSQLKERIPVIIEKGNDNGPAFYTHYLHNFDTSFATSLREPAFEYIASCGQKETPAVQSLLPINWDIPYPPVKEPKFTFIDLFAGIGGIRIGYQKAGGKCVFSSEYDHFAQQTYEANFGEVPFGDIRDINEKDIPDHDILVAGFPCQPFSIAGVSKKQSLGRDHGFLDKAQGTLFFDIARIIKKKRPKAFMLENVKNLVSHDKGKTFEVIKGTLEELGYNIHYKVIDGANYVPQHRERIIITGFDKKVFKGKEDFEFPDFSKKKKNPHVLKEILEQKVDDKYTLSDKLWKYLQAYAEKHKKKGNGFGYGMADLKGTTRTLSARYYKDGAEILIPQRGKNPRRLTPRECARLQGFDDKFIIPVSNNQAYKQFGNSVVVPLMSDMAKRVYKAIETK